MTNFIFDGFEDRYGFAKQLRVLSDWELVEAINREVDLESWVNTRKDYITHLGNELLSRDLDSSAIISNGKMSLCNHIRIVRKTLVPMTGRSWSDIYEIDPN